MGWVKVRLRMGWYGFIVEQSVRQSDSQTARQSDSQPIRHSCLNAHRHRTYLIQVEAQQPRQALVGHCEHDQPAGNVAAETATATATATADAVLHAGQGHIPVGGCGGVQLACGGWLEKRVRRGIMIGTTRGVRGGRKGSGRGS